VKDTSTIQWARNRGISAETSKRTKSHFAQPTNSEMGVPGDRVRLTDHEYDQLRRATQTHREELVIRLCGEVGLRAAEIERLRPAAVSGEGSQGRTRYFVTVDEGDGETRTAYMPAQVAHDFWQFIRSNAIDTEDRVVPVSERRIQMLIGEVGERAAAETGRPIFEQVTPSALRAYFARTLLVSNGIDARVVTAVGGWQSIDGLLHSFGKPTRAEIARAFEALETRSRDQRGWLPRIVTTLEAVDEELIAASTRTEINRRVVERLTDLYDAAWILDQDSAESAVSVRAHAGESPDRFSGPANSGLVRRAMQTGQAMVAPDDPGPNTTVEGRGMLGAVPIAHGETSYGALVVRADREDAFDKPERTALSALGRRIAFGITATERRLLLLGGTLLKLRFSYHDEGAPLVALSQAISCSLALDGAVPTAGQSLLCFVDISGATAEVALDAAAAIDGITDARLIQNYEDGGRLELVIQSSPVVLLSERGATITELSVQNGTASLVCEVTPDTDVRSLNDALMTQFSTIELRGKQEQSAKDGSQTTGDTLDETLTEKQRSVLEGAYHAGYFEWPRGSTAEDLAESMGVSAPTLHNHLRKAQQKLLEDLFEE